MDHFDVADGEVGAEKERDATGGGDLGIYGITAHYAVVAVFKTDGIGGIGHAPDGVGGPAVVGHGDGLWVTTFNSDGD